MNKKYTCNNALYINDELVKWIEFLLYVLVVNVIIWMIIEIFKVSKIMFMVAK